MLMLWCLEILKALNDRSHAKWEAEQASRQEGLAQMDTDELVKLRDTANDIIQHRQEQQRQSGFEGPLPGPKPPKHGPNFEGPLKPGGVPRDATK